MLVKIEIDLEEEDLEEEDLDITITAIHHIIIIDIN